MSVHKHDTTDWPSDALDAGQLRPYYPAAGTEEISGNGETMASAINVIFDDDELEKAKDVKGNRTWREAILDEFGVAYEDDSGE